MLPVFPANELAQRAVRSRLDSLTKPQGSLGFLEDLVIKQVGISGRIFSTPIRKGILIFAGDHGVVCHGVSAFPQRVTCEMLKNFDRGGAAINVLAQRFGAELSVVDVGVIAGSATDFARVRERAVVQGTRDFTAGPALSIDEVAACIKVGREETRRLIDHGIELLALGEMGIGNTTAASAITSVICRAPVPAVTGPGTGISAEAVARKVGCIERGIAKNQNLLCDPLDILSAFGGAEIAALVGAMLEAAESRLPIVLDGFIVGAAALVAEKLEPGLKNFMFAGHTSAEPGHQFQLSWLELRAIVTLNMRLGEGTGAALAMDVIESAVQLTREMLTFDEARVSRGRGSIYLLSMCG